MAKARTIFITGTDTSVGKTAVTALLLAHAQAEGRDVRALKPFSTGGVSDEALLGALQKHSLEINFFHFPEPVAPWSAARKRNMPVTLESAVEPMRKHQAACELLLVEGAGGLLSPLGERFSAAELITELGAEVTLVAANRIGVLNHTLLTVEALRRRGVAAIGVALVEHEGADMTRKSNRADLLELLGDVPVVAIPFLENYRFDADFIRGAAEGLRDELGELLRGKKNPPDTEAGGTFP